MAEPLTSSIYQDHTFNNSENTVSFGLPILSLPSVVKPQGALLYNLVDTQVYVSNGIIWKPIGGGTIDQPIHVTDITQSTSPTTGSITTAGGAGIALNLNVGGITTVYNTTQSTSPTTGALVTGGGAGIGGNIYVGGSVTSEGQIVVMNTTSSTSPTTGAVIIVGGLGVGGSVNITNNITNGGTIINNNTTNSTSVTTGAVIIAGGVGITKNVYIGGNTVINGPTTVTNITNSTSTTTGAVIVAGGIGIGGNTYIGGSTTIIGITNVTNTTNTTSTTSGAVVISGGVGITKDIYIGGNTYSIGFTEVMNVTNSTSITTGALIVAGGVGITKDIYIGGNTYSIGFTEITNTTNSTSTTTGALIVYGGVGITKDVYIGGNTYNIGFTQITNTTNSTSISTGALIVYGGVGITKDVYIGGNTYNIGITNITNTTNSTSITTGALIIAGGVGITANLYIGGITNISNTTNSTSITTGALIIAGGVGITANLYIGGITNISNTTNSTSTTTGALTIVGGVGIGGNTYIGGNLVVNGTISGSFNPTGPVHITDTTVSTSPTTGALTVTGGVGIGGAVNTSGPITTSGIVTITNTTASTSTTTGAEVIAGGLGVGGTINAGGVNLVNPTDDPYYTPFVYTNPAYTAYALAAERTAETRGWDTPNPADFINPMSTYVPMETFDVLLEWSFVDARYFIYMQDSLDATGGSTQPPGTEPVYPFSFNVLPAWAQSQYTTNNGQLWAAAYNARMRVVKIGKMVSLFCCPIFFANSQILQGGFFWCIQPHIPSQYMPLTYNAQAMLGSIYPREFNSGNYYHGCLICTESRIGDPWGMPVEAPVLAFQDDDPYFPGQVYWSYPLPSTVILFKDKYFGSSVEGALLAGSIFDIPADYPELGTGTSSCQISPGTTCTFYTQVGWEGSFFELSTSMANFAQTNYNDQIASVQIGFQPDWNETYYTEGLSVYFIRNVQESSPSATGNGLAVAQKVLSAIGSGLGLFKILGVTGIGLVIVGVLSTILSIIQQGLGIIAILTSSGNPLQYGSPNAYFPDPNESGNDTHQDYYWDAWSVQYTTDI